MCLGLSRVFYKAVGFGSGVAVSGTLYRGADLSVSKEVVFEEGPESGIYHANLRFDVYDKYLLVVRENGAKTATKTFDVWPETGVVRYYAEGT